jgi:hypothetical protein
MSQKLKLMWWLHTFQKVIAIVKLFPWRHLFVASTDTISDSPENKPNKKYLGIYVIIPVFLS